MHDYYDEWQMCFVHSESNEYWNQITILKEYFWNNMNYALVSKANAEFFRFNCQHECNPLENWEISTHAPLKTDQLKRKIV